MRTQFVFDSPSSTRRSSVASGLGSMWVAPKWPHAARLTRPQLHLDPNGPARLSGGFLAGRASMCCDVGLAGLFAGRSISCSIWPVSGLFTPTHMEGDPLTPATE